MYAAAGEDGSGHERAHDPCRADWHDVTAEHPGWPSRSGLLTLGWLLPGSLVLLLAIATIWSVHAI
ncbi:MAG: hypothetical protein M3P23_03905 [Actinomycetota bacterium]|nr:hypothetical protein [Actinomycetota bacterium]